MCQTERSTSSDRRLLSRLLDRGRELAAAGDVKGAARVYQIACLGHPLDPAPWIGAGLCQKHLGDSRAAELALAIAVALGADHPGVLVHHAECLVRLGKLDRARDDLSDAIAAAEDLCDDVTPGRARRTLEWLDGLEVKL